MQTNTHHHQASMKLRAIFAFASGALLAGLFLALVPVAAAAEPALWNTPPKAIPADPGTEESLLGAPPRSAAAAEEATPSFTLTPAAEESKREIEFWMNGAVARRFGAPAAVENDAALSEHAAQPDGEIADYTAGIFLPDNVSEDVLFSTATGSYLNSLPLHQLVPVPEPTTALFGLAMVGFCALARARVKAKA